MIKTRFCKCGRELKTKKATQCPKCASKQRKNWTQTDEEMLIAYCKTTAQITTLKTQINTLTENAVTLKKTLQKNHKPQVINCKLAYLKTTGQIPRVKRAYIKVGETA